MGVGGGWTGVFLTALAPGCFPNNSQSRAWTGVGAVATPSLRVPLCERAALGGGWCRPPAAPSSGGGGAAPSSQGQVLLRPESAVRAREVQHSRLRVGNLAALPTFMGRRVAGDPLSGAGL